MAQAMSGICNVLGFDEILIEHSARNGHQREYGACELRRQIRQLLEPKLARLLFRGYIKKGNRPMHSYGSDRHEVSFAVEPAQPASPSDADLEGAKKTRSKETSQPAGSKARKDRAELKAEADAMLDEALRETFPASDALSITRDRPIDDREG